MISGYQAALSGLQAYGTRVQSNANNIANAQTNGYKKTRVTLSSVEPQGVKANVEKVESTPSSVFEQGPNGEELVELSNVNLASEFTEMNSNKHMYTANLKTIQVTDEMEGTLLDIIS